MYIKDKKIIISAAITGATHVPSLSKYLPKNPDEIICSAIEAWRAGAAVVHIHARAQDGKPTTDHGIFRYILSSISRVRCGNRNYYRGSKRNERGGTFFSD